MITRLALGFVAFTALAALATLQGAASGQLVTKWDYFVVSTPDFVGPFRGNDAAFHAPVPVDVAKQKMGGEQGIIGQYEVIVDTEGKVTVGHDLTTPEPKNNKRIREVLGQWRFRPATLDRKAIRVSLRVSISNEMA